MLSRFAFAAPLAGLALGALPQAQSAFATQIVSYVQGSGSGIFDTSNLLGGPIGGGLSLGSVDVLTLGGGGEVTVGFDVTLTDGPGADFSVFENGFVVTGTSDVFAEVAFVEVSTDGLTFARFPTSYAGSGTAMGAYRGLSGGMPVLADVTVDPASPFDPVTSGGEAFDLADLAGDPDVLSGSVDLSAIHYVRLVDVEGAVPDDGGTPIVDSGAADFDAIAVLNSVESSSPGQPVCDLFLDASNRVNLVLGDPDGFWTLDFAAIQASLDLTPVSMLALLPAFQLTSFTPTEVHLTSAPLTGSGLQAALAVSVRDLGGAFSGDQLMLQE